MIGSGAMALLLLVGGMSYVGFQGSEDLPIPTLALDIAPQYSPSLLGNLVGEKDGIPVHVFSAEEARVGFTAIKDEHVIFDCPAAITPSLGQEVAHGYLKALNAVRVWGYEYSGRELQNKNAGKTGRDLFDGRFWISTAELNVSPQFSYLHTGNMRMVASKRYYLMMDGVTGGAAPFRVSCLDRDNDLLNDGGEDLNGNGVVDAGETKPTDGDTDDDGVVDGMEAAPQNQGGFSASDPLKIDTDGDGLQDGTELGLTAGHNPDTNSAVFIPDADPATTTDPTKADTDNDGIPDGEEDANKNGKLDPGEWDPIVSNPPICGDSKIWGVETCDDGNTVAGDGCTASCTTENGWQCAVSPSVVCITQFGWQCVNPSICEIITPSFSDPSSGLNIEIHNILYSLEKGLDDYDADLTEERIGSAGEEIVTQGLYAGELPTESFGLSVQKHTTVDNAAIAFVQVPSRDYSNDAYPLPLAPALFTAEESFCYVGAQSQYESGDYESDSCDGGLCPSVSFPIRNFDCTFRRKNILVSVSSAFEDQNLSRSALDAHVQNFAEDILGHFAQRLQLLTQGQLPENGGGTISDTGAPANLFITERSLGTSDTTVENAGNLQLFRFEASAGDEDISLTQVVMKSDAGTLIDAGNYTLWVDADHNGVVDTILEDGQTSTTDTVTFNDLVGGGYTIPAQRAVMFEVHADISGSISGTTFAIGFNDNDGVATTFNFIEAERADNGAALSCISVNGTASTTSGCSSSNAQIVVNSATSKVFNVKEQGTLFVVKDASPTRSRQLLAGELGEAVLRLELRADDEAIDVTRLVITNSGASSANISRFQLYRPGEITHFASATADNCTSISTDFFAGTSGTSGAAQAFCAIMESQQLVIAEGLREDVLVRPLMKTDEQGAVSSSTDGGLGLVRAMILPNTLSNGVGQTNNTMGTGSITARGLLSSNVLLTNDNDTNQDGEIVIGSDTPGIDTLIIGNKNDTVLAKIVTIENVNPAADGTNVPTGTNKTIAEFKFTAATNNNTLNGRNKATLSGLIFNISSTNVNFTAANFDLFNKNDQTQEINCVPYDSYDSPGDAYSETMIADSFFVECKRSDNTAVNLEMDSGGSITLVLQADISNNQVQASAGSLLTVFLNNLSQGLLGGPGGMYAPTPFGTHIQWLDGTQVFSWVEYPETEIRSTNYDL